MEKEFENHFDKWKQEEKGQYRFPHSINIEASYYGTEYQGDVDPDTQLPRYQIQ